MDYSKMSDFEINKRVASAMYRLECETLSHLSHRLYYSDGGQQGPVVCDIGGEDYFDPCNNPADAWPIITENNISIILDNPTMPCATANARDLFDDADPIVSVVYDKPLRAAMIVYLQLQEAK